MTPVSARPLRPARTLLRRALAGLLAASLGACGGSSGTTVAGCTAATIKAITTGDLGNTNAPEYPECVGLSDADLMKAGQDAFSDPEVKAYIAGLVQQGGGAVEGSGSSVPPRPAG